MVNTIEESYSQGCQIGEKAPVGLLLALWLPKLWLWRLVLFGLLSESMAVTSGDLRQVFCWVLFRPGVAKSVDSP